MKRTLLPVLLASLWLGACSTTPKPTVTAADATAADRTPSNSAVRVTRSPATRRRSSGSNLVASSAC